MASSSPSSALQELIPFEISSSDIKGFEDEESRGSGSYGAVYAVTVRGTCRVAKRLHSILVGADVNQSEKQGIRERFLNECVLLSKLDHPNVVKFIGVHFNHEDRSDVTLIMEQLHMDLDKFLDPDQRPDIDIFTKLSILHDVSSGLLYLHTQLAKPIIHRDLTAGNVLLTEDFKQAKIADLGVSKLIDHHLHQAATRTACPGTLAYMPPEALTDKPKYNTPLDVFSFGQLSLYVALQQFPVAYEMSSEEAIRAYQLGEVAIFKRKKWLDKLPEDHCLRDLILSCLRDNPSERPSTESLNIKMKVLCGLELEEFEINNVIGIIDGEMYGSYIAVYKVIARGAPRIAKRLNNVLNSELVSDISPSERQRIREQFHSECVALSKLDHPNIVKFIGVHFNPKDRSDMAVIFEHLHVSLKEFLNPPVFPDIHLNTKLSILYSISCGLLYLHTQLEAPFIHGELTAANVLLKEDLKQAKIADLGVLKLLDVKKQNKYFQALAYLPPEVFSDNPKYGTPVDVFSFGHLALYVALQQFPEISHKEALTVTRKKREIEVLKRKKYIDELGQDHCLRELILQCLKDDPKKRPTTAEVNNIMSTLNNAINPERRTKDVVLQNQFAELFHICRSGQLDILKEFIYCNQGILNYARSTRTPKGTTILHEAVDGEQPDVIQMLLLHGFNPDMQARGGLTPLHLAVFRCSVGCVRALVENGADLYIRDELGQDAIAKAELRSKKREVVLRLVRSKEIVILAERGLLKELEKRLKQSPKPEMRDIEEALLAAIRNGNDVCAPLLVVAGARRLDCAIYLAIQLERIKALAILLLCKATINGDTAAIRSLLSEPPESANIPWYMPKVHETLSQGKIRMSYPIAISIFEKKYEATKELLLRTGLDMGHKQVDWSKLKLTILHSSWMYSIAPWVVSLNLVNNHLRKLPSEMLSATQLRRLDLSQNLLETVSTDLFALPNLECLLLCHNRLKEVPETTNWSTSLLLLDLSENLLSTLPQGIQHSSIEILNLSRNQFTLVPKCLCRIRTLTSLDLSYMPISSLPKEMEHLDHLVNLNISNANITDLPNGGGVLRGGIRGIFRARARSNKPCNYVKLMLFCHSDIIKTVMLSRLKPHFNPSQLLPNYPLPEIDVFHWSFKPLFTRKVFVSPKLYFNTWLIGSHYSCRSIYPCFFTPGALYIIMWDLTTTADLQDQIKPYIDLLIRYVPYTNILVIAILPEQFKVRNNEKQAEVLAARLNTFFSKPSYQSLSYHGVLMMGANPNVKEGQSDLKQRLYDVAQQMTVNGKHIIGRQIPEIYFSLIPVLEKEQQAFRLKSKPGVLEESTIWMLFDRALASDPPDKIELPVMVDFLKEAGFLLYYEDPNDQLDRCYFIRPIWLYNTLLRVIRHVLEHRSHLFLTHSELCSLANISWSKDIAQALIRLMIRYAIVLPIRRDQYLITCLLPHSQPPSDVLYCGLLRRQFAPKAHSIPVDFWSRLLCSVIFNLSHIVDVSKLKQETKIKSKKIDPDSDQTHSDQNLFARANNLVQEAVDGSQKVRSKEPNLKKKEYTSRMNSQEEGKDGNENKCGENEEPFGTDDMLDIQPTSLTDKSESVLDRHFTQLQLTDLLYIKDSSCDNMPVDSPDDGSKPLKYSTRQLPLKLPDHSTIEMDQAASVNIGEIEKTVIKEGKELNEGQKENQEDEVQPQSGNRDSAIVAAKRKVDLPISPTAKLASRKTSPAKHFGRERSSTPVSTDSSKTPSTSSAPVSGQLEVNPRHSLEGSRLQRHIRAPLKKRDSSRHSTYAKPAIIDKGVEIWECGMIYNHKGVKFSIFPCVSEASTVEERGIEICCTRDTYGHAIMARLCWLVQRNLEERFPYLFSTETPLQKHELTQIAICPTCLEKNERNPPCFLIEACVHALKLKGELNCKYHPEVIPLRDLVPDYLLLDFPSHLCLTKTMFEYNEAKPLHKGRQTILHTGHFNGEEVAIKLYHQVDSRSIILPLACVRRESDMLNSLNHQNIVKIFGFCLDPACVLVEKAPLGNLYQKLMDTEVKINRTVRFHIGCQVASALSYLHQRDIIYRTLKASSILLWSLDFNFEPSIKLANFERAAYQSPSGLMSKTTFSSYPAPEMLRYFFREEYTEKVDIYSFGILLYELVTRWQPYGGSTRSQKPKLSAVVTTSYSTIVKLMEECWQEEAMVRPSADDLLLQLSQPSFQCHITSQVLRDCVSVRGCSFVPSVQQIWIYGEYYKTSLYGEREISEGTQVFILNAENLIVQGSLELRERANAMFTVDSKVWIGMTELCVHAYDTTTFRFTDRFHLDDSVTTIADNDCYAFIGQANGQLKCYSKLQLQRGDCQPIVVEIGDKPVITMITIGDIIWLGCGNELVILNAEDEVTIKQRAQVCESSDQVYSMAISHNTNTVWCLGRNSHCITSWDIHTTEKKLTVDLSEHLKLICCELNYDPTFLRMVSIECVSDTLWVGLSCGVIMILSDTEQPEEIIHFKAHRQATKCLLKIPHSDDLHQQHDHPVILSGGFGEVSSLSSTTSEQNGVVMLWHAFTANEFSTISKRHSKYNVTVT